MSDEIAPAGAKVGGVEAKAQVSVVGVPKKKRVNLLDALKGGEQTTVLEIVRINENETAIIPFTVEGEQVLLHYCDEPEIGGYVQCNGANCVLCLAGRKPDLRTLIPVYVPGARAIGVLPISPSLRPHALLPQFYPVLTANKPMVAFVKKDGPTTFLVSSSELPKDADGGEDVIVPFMTRWESGEISLESAFQKIPNEQLKMVPGIASILALKGGTVR